jgi:hypothetical protein
VRLTYNSTTDILYVGLNSYETVGDADTDGNEGLKSYGTGVDQPNLGLGEVVTVYFDLDQDGWWDVIAGKPSGTDFSGFTVNTAVGPTTVQAFFGAANLSAAHLGDVFWDVSLGPDLEFEIEDFSLLPGQGGELAAFNVAVFMGSLNDGSIGEDFLTGSGSPSINVEKLVSKDNVNFYDADTAGEALGVSASDDVYFMYIVTNTGNVTLTGITLSDDIHDVSGITKTDPLDPLASFNGTIGPIDPLAGLQTDLATATGDWDGFTVQDTDPANYVGIDARISIAPNATNPVGMAHDFTVTVESTLDGITWDPVVGINVTPSLDGSSTAGAIISAPPYTTNGSGQVTVTVNSSVAGVAYVHASASVPVGGEFIEVATDGYGAWIVDNEKTWVDARISIEESGTNPVNTATTSR